MNSKSFSFLHDGHEFTVRATAEDNGWVIHVFKDNHPCPMVEHSLSYQTQKDALTSRGIDLLSHMMQVAKEDVERNLEQDVKC